MYIVVYTRIATFNGYIVCGSVRWLTILVMFLMEPGLIWFYDIFPKKDAP